MAQQTHGDWIKKNTDIAAKKPPFHDFFLKIWLFFWMVIDWCSIRKKIAVGFVVNFERKLQFYSSIFIFIFYKKKLFFFLKNTQSGNFPKQKMMPLCDRLNLSQKSKNKINFLQTCSFVIFYEISHFCKNRICPLYIVMK